MSRWVWRLLLAMAVVTVACQPGSRTRVSDGSELARVLDAHARAHGFSRDVPQTRALHVEAAVEAFGFEGSLEVWSEPPLYARARLEVGPILMETGFDGDTGWILDRNGSVRSAEGTERAGMLLDALLSTGAYVLAAPPARVDRRLLGPDAEPRPQEAQGVTPAKTIVLSLHVEGAEPQRLTIDAQSFQLMSTQWHNGQFLDQTRFDDYRPVNGRLVAHRVTMDYGPSMQLKARVEVAEHVPPRGAGFYRSPETDRASAPRFAQGSDSGAIPFALHEQHIFATAVLNGSHTGAFLVDTGAAGNVLNQRYLDELGLRAEGRVHATGAVGSTPGSFVAVDQLQIGGMTLSQQSWIALDLADIEAAFERRILGVLGYDTLSRVALEINYAENWLRFHAPGTWNAGPDATRLALRMDSNIPSVLAVVEDVPAWVHLDTGSDNALDLMEPFVAAHSLLEGREDLVRSHIQGVGGAGETLRGTVAGLQLGELRFRNVTTNFNGKSEGIFGSSSIAGIVGAELLRQFHCVFDYSTGAVWLTPPSRGR